MAKKDISNIITHGSLKQRANLVAEYHARENYVNTSNEPFLTKSEHTALMKSFKTPLEVRVLDKIRYLDRAIKIGLTNLQGLLFELQMHQANLRGYILCWMNIEASERITNTILHQIPEEERKGIARKLEDERAVFFTKIEMDDEGYLKFLIDQGDRKTTLLYAMGNIKNSIEKTAVKYNSWKKAILDVMDKNSIRPVTYRNILKEYDLRAYQPVLGINKYETDSDIFSRGEKGHPFLDKHKPRYNVTPPNLESLGIDEEAYNFFRKEILKQ